MLEPDPVPALFYEFEVLGLGGRLLGALAGRFTPWGVGAEEELLMNLEEETRGL